MKKTLKSILAAMLAAIMAFGTVSAFAADESDTLEWNYYGDLFYYEYAGELKEGTTALDNISDNYIYFTLNVEEQGYYIISYDYDNLEAWTGLPEKIEDGVAFDEKDYLDCGSEVSLNKVYYLEKGETYLAADIYSTSDDSEISFEYLGKDITSVDIPNEAVIDCNFYYWYNDDEAEFTLYSDITVTFDDENAIVLDNIDGTTDEIKSNAENAVKLNLAGKEYDATIMLYEISHYVSDVSLSNTDVKVYYDGLMADYPDLTVTFSDGTTQSISLSDNYYITLPNGCEVYVWLSYYTYRGEVEAEVYFNDALFKTINCNSEKASFSENISHFKENVSYYFEDIYYYLSNAALFISWAGDCVVYAMQEISYFISYYLF